MPVMLDVPHVRDTCGPSRTPPLTAFLAFISRQDNYHSYTHLIVALGIVREPTVWVFITSKYPGTHDIGLPTVVFTIR